MSDTVNDEVMAAIRAEYVVMDLIIKNVQYDGKAIKSEAWQAFQEIRTLRHYVERLELMLIEARNPGIDMNEVRRSRATSSTADGSA